MRLIKRLQLAIKHYLHHNPKTPLLISPSPLQHSLTFSSLNCNQTKEFILLCALLFAKPKIHSSLYALFFIVFIYPNQTHPIFSKFLNSHSKWLLYCATTLNLSKPKSNPPKHIIFFCKLYEVILHLNKKIFVFKLSSKDML